jgi:arsenite/tail-anchored protein-transporting ATPase
MPFTTMKNLISNPLPFLLFGGKGGVGKTTMASATAVELATTYPNKKVLLFTTDPAPSLGHIFEQELSNEPQLISGFNNLFALEINAEEELKKFKQQYGADIIDILQKGTYLSDEETEDMFSLDIPGLDEVMGLKKIMDFMNSNEYDYFLLDTAPTGHTLRLLCLPELLDRWIKMLASLRWKYRYMVERFGKGSGKEQADDFLLEMKKTVKKVQNMLRDKEKTSFIVVTIAEALGVLETQHLIKELKKSSIPCSNIIINSIVPKDQNSFLASRRKLQEKYIQQIKTSFKGFNVKTIQLEPEEIKGMLSLQKIASTLFT